ncbi:MAG: hypothetical protein OEZ34_12125, partial [Spirochaetia bacterium]|nr:hypothetical protein [Spirochaetia bacterium]
RFGQVVFHPEIMLPEKLEHLCQEARKLFYSLPSIFKRILEFRSNASSLKKIVFYFSLNLMLKREVKEKKGIPLGLIREEAEKL